MVKKKVAILGGGIGAMTAAFQLTNTPNWQNELEVTVYQIGWRLGGKCATSRNSKIRDRIEEHGIHYLLGFYENAFHVIRQVYEECKKSKLPMPFPTWCQAFRKQSCITAMVDEQDRWTSFGIIWPTFEDLPGDPDRFDRKEHPPLGWDLVKLLLCRAAEWASGLISDPRSEFTWQQKLLLQAIAAWLQGACRLAQRLERAPQAESFEALEILILLNRTTDAMTGSIIDPMPSAAIEAATVLHKPTLSDFARYMLVMLDIGSTMAKGMLRDQLTGGDFNPVDNIEFEAWLKKHGCRDPRFAVIRSGYDACFAYLGGDPNRQSMSAAVALNGGLRLWLTYRGSIFWPMRAGMAEVIFSPIYRLLRHRGVKFRFFNRVKELHLSADRKSIDRIEIDIQARLKDGRSTYEPLITVGNIECWPDTPLYDQLKDPDGLKNKDMESAWNAPAPVGQCMLLRGTHFDAVVFGIALGAVRYLCPQLVAASDKWRQMVDNVPTVQTQALQLWMHLTAQQCGFDAGTLMPMPAGELPCVSSFVKPFDTYVDQTDVKEVESWRPEDDVQHVAYFCSTFPDATQIPPPGDNPQFVTDQQKRVRNNALKFVTKHLPVLFPNTKKGVGSFNWDVLVDIGNGKAEARLGAQFMRANIDPSARYVLSPPGTMAARLAPDASQFDNLFLAGDWTFTPMNSGCVEAATMSGLRAASAVSGKPVHIYGWR
jgi:uncharacterized protein with NAD-binding domain and iron-sulfur cluster